MITSKIAGAVLALTTVAPVTYQALNHRPPIGIIGMKQAGPAIPDRDSFIWIDFDGKADCPTHVERSLIDSAGIVTPFKTVETSHIGNYGGRPQLYRLHIPMDASEGEGLYRVTFVFRCNFVQSAFPVVRTYDVPLKIGKGKT